MTKELLFLFSFLLVSSFSRGHNERTSQISTPYVYEVTSDPEAVSATMLQILQKLPYITVDAFDQVAVSGQKDITLFVDGTPQKLSASLLGTFLKSFPANRVERVEITTSRRVSDQTLGSGGCIFIITRSQNSDGVAVQVAAQGATSTQVGADVMLNVKHKGFYLNGGYAYKYRNYGEMAVVDSTVGSPDFDYRLRNNLSQQVTVNTGLQFTKNDKLGATLVLFDHSLDMSWNKINSYNTRDSYDELSGKSRSANVFYEHQFSKGISVRLTYEYSYNKTGDDEIETSIPNQWTEYSYWRRIFNLDDENNNMNAIRLDAYIPIGKKSVVEWGIRHAKNKNIRNVCLNTLIGPENMDIPTAPMKDIESYSGLSRIYYGYDVRYTPKYWSTYVNYILNLNPITVSAGLLGETTYRPHIDSDDSFKFYPSLNVHWQVGSRSAFSLQYTSQYRSNSSAFLWLAKAGSIGYERLHKFNVNYQYAGQKLHFLVDASHVDCPHTNIIGKLWYYSWNYKPYDPFNPYGNFIDRTFNAKFRQTQLTLSARYRLSPSIHLHGLGMLAYRHLNIDSDGMAIYPDNSQGFYGQLSGGSDFLLPKDFCLAVNGGYYFPLETPNGKEPQNYFYRLNLSKSFAQKHWEVALYATDFFGSKRINRKEKTFVESKLEWVGKSVKYSLPTNEIGLSLTYRF